MRSGWQTKRISEIAHHSLGKMLDKAKNKGEPQPYLRNLNVRWSEFDLSNLLEMRFLPEEEARYTVQKGDLVICEGGYPGRAAIWDSDEPIYFQKALHRVRFHEPRRAKWCLYYLQSRDLDGTLRQHFNGSGIQHFTGEALARFEIPLPPLPDQRRIVGILDEAFAGIAAAKAHAEQNRQNARALFESHLHGVFGRASHETRLSEITSDVTDGDHSPPPKSSSGIPFITISDIAKSTRTIDFNNTFTVSRDYFRGLKANRRPKRGDVLYTVTGATLGIPVLVDHDTEFCFQRHIGLIRANQETDSRWLSYAMLSPQVFRQATVGSTGAAQKTVSLSVLRNIRVPKIPLKEQRAIATQLDALQTETQRLESLYARKLAALDELKAALLHQAFSGQL